MNVSQVLDVALKAKAEVGRPSARRWRGSLLGACVRQQWYNAEKVEPSNPFPDSLYRVFERGHVVAEVLNRAGREAERLGLLESFREEVPLVWDEYNFSGNADAVVLRKDGINEVWEYKSINSRGMQYLKGVKPEHAIQASIYAHILELQTGDPHEARVVYVAADNFQIVRRIKGGVTQASAKNTIRIHASTNKSAAINMDVTGRIQITKQNQVVVVQWGSRYHR